MTFQQVRVWNVQTNQCDMELRDHDHVIECVAWAPKTAYENICAAAGIEVCYVIILDFW